MLFQTCMTVLLSWNTKKSFLKNVQAALLHTICQHTVSGRGLSSSEMDKKCHKSSQYDLSTAFVSLLIVLCEGPFNILAFISHSCFCAFKHFSKAQSYGKNHKVHESLQQA